MEKMYSFSDCPAGKTGSFCLRGCVAGSFGVGCLEKCGRCKNGLCSAVDGIPSLQGASPSAVQFNESAIVITWTQDPQIPAEHSPYFGYTVAYAGGAADLTDGPSVAHDAANSQMNQTIRVTCSTIEYRLRVRVYREMSSARQYGRPSEIISIRSTAEQFADEAETDAKWKPVAMATGVVLGVVVSILIGTNVFHLMRHKQIQAEGAKQEEVIFHKKCNTAEDQASAMTAGPLYANVNPNSIPPMVDEAEHRYESLDTETMTDIHKGAFADENILICDAPKG
uniref:Uncharacterized protein n=1 Tax=Capitella teleta TaxID=283909 RepID=X2A7W6_CAPTE